MASSDRDAAKHPELQTPSRPSQASIDDLWREILRMREAMSVADKAASAAHDYIYGDEHGTVTMDEANEAIWTIHNALRPYIGGRS